jgi:hypothetical protein
MTLNDQVSCWDLIIMMRKIHPRTEDFSEGDLFERIKRFDMYTLQEISLCDIHRGRYDLDDSLIEEYAELAVNTQPPIILSEPFGDKRDVVDGNHRVEAQAKRNIDKLLGFIPLEETKIDDCDEEE